MMELKRNVDVRLSRDADGRARMDYRENGGDWQYCGHLVKGKKSEVVLHLTSRLDLSANWEMTAWRKSETALNGDARAFGFAANG